MAVSKPVIRAFARPVQLESLELWAGKSKNAKSVSRRRHESYNLTRKMPFCQAVYENCDGQHVPVLFVKWYETRVTSGV